MTPMLGHKDCNDHQQHAKEEDATVTTAHYRRNKLAKLVQCKMPNVPQLVNIRCVPKICCQTKQPIAQGTTKDDAYSFALVLVWQCSKAGTGAVTKYT